MKAKQTRTSIMWKNALNCVENRRKLVLYEIAHALQGSYDRQFYLKAKYIL